MVPGEDADVKRAKVSEEGRYEVGVKEEEDDASGEELSVKALDETAAVLAA